MAEIVVALDLPSVDEALRFLDRLPSPGWVKVGPMLFLKGGAELVRECRRRGTRVFLDLKWHDIPHAVAGAVRSAADLGVALATVHALGGRAMMAAAAQAAQGSAVRLVGVSVLTSHAAADYAQAVGRPGPVDLRQEVGRLARDAMESGLGGVVASPQEISVVRPIVGEAWIVVPGIRPAGSAADDQRRTAEPMAAVRAGATHLVVGRPLTGSADPAAVYEELCASIS